MKKNIIKYQAKWKLRGYKELPDEVPQRLHELKRAPSWKGIALAILNNDHHLVSLGQPTKKSIYYGILKKIEIDARKA